MHVLNPNRNQGLEARVAALASAVETMGGQLSECYAAAASELPARLSEVEARIQATAQTCADAVKVCAGGGAQLLGFGFETLGFRARHVGPW
jgi:predicted amino acid dehydrogenase